MLYFSKQRFRNLHQNKYQSPYIYLSCCHTSFVLSPPINFSQADWENTLAVHLCHSFSAVTVTANCLFTFHPEKPAYWGLNTVKSGGLPTFQNYFPNRHVMGGGSFSGPGKGSGVEKDNIWWGKSVTPDQGCHPALWVCIPPHHMQSF